MFVSRPAPSAEETPHQPAVLVVEDEILIRTAVAEYLRHSGYLVLEAADAAEALNLFGVGEPIDVVICDVNMPGDMDGLSLARQIKQHQPKLPVLLTSGRGIALTAADRMAFLFVSKPYHLKVLAERLKLMLASRDLLPEGSPEPKSR